MAPMSLLCLRCVAATRRPKLLRFFASLRMTAPCVFPWPVKPAPRRRVLFSAGLRIRYARDVQMNPRVTVLATLHVVQGAEKRVGNVLDPVYVALLEKLMLSEGVDFIFEEASGLGPTIAEKLALERLPFGH